MSIVKSSLFRAAASIIALTAATAAASAVQAQEAPAPADAEADAAADEGLREIIVTAQKRPEDLQATPIAISVMKTEDLVNRHVSSLLDLGDGSIPSLRVAPFFSRQSALVVNVRGIGILSDSNQPARDQGVGVYIDGVYQGRAQGLGTAIYDVENIEVLKGPQGTLFGRNTEGGAVSIVTKRPSGEFKLNATGGAGNYGSYKGEIHLDLPSIAGFSIKLDGVATHRDGIVKNPLASAEDFGGYTKRGFHGEVLWKPVPEFSADYSFDTSYDSSTSLYYQLIEGPVGLPATASGAAAIKPNKLAAIALVQPERADTAVVGVPQHPSIGKTHGHRLNLEWEVLPSLTLKSITAYRKLRQGQFDNGSAAPGLQQPLTTANPTGNFTGFNFARASLAEFRQHQFSQEFQAIGDIGRVKFAFGALYYKETVQDNAQAYNTATFTDAAGSTYTTTDPDPATKPIDRASRVHSTSVGVYGQGTWTPAVMNDMLHLTLGARYTHDKKEGSLFTINNAPPTIPIGGVNVTGPIPLNASWSRVDPLVNLSIDLTDDIHVYGKWSTGYRSGGANSRSLSYASFDPETVSMFEVGAKTEFWDNRARFNLAAYTGSYKDIQLDFFGLYEDVVNGVRVATTRTTSDTVNAPGTGRLRGVEAEFTLAPVDGLTLSASYAYNHVRIPATLNPFRQPGGALITVPVPIYPIYTPGHSASGAIDYELPLAGMALRLHLDGNYDSGYYVNFNDVAFDPVTRAVRYAQPKGDEAFIVNGRIALADIELSGGAKVTVAAWARNLFDEEHVFYKTGSATAGVSGFFNDPRTFGAEINVKY